ncbi:hypothetical protein ABIC09_001433 [Bradyrhizobium sp. S3.12.5]
MPGPVPGIHVLCAAGQNVDGWDKARAIHVVEASAPLSLHVIASAAKQSRVFPRRDSGLLGCARNDGSSTMLDRADRAAELGEAAEAADGSIAGIGALGRGEIIEHAVAVVRAEYDLLVR